MMTPGTCPPRTVMARASAVGHLGVVMLGQAEPEDPA